MSSDDRQTDSDTPADYSDPALVQEVREVAGKRISPRQIEIVGQALEDAGFEVSAESVSEVIELTDGDLSKRQRRNSQMWRRLGADLAIRGQDGTPEGQRLFLGQARRASGPKPSDQLLLALSLALAISSDDLLNPNFAGSIARQHAHHTEIPSDQELLKIVAAAREQRQQKYQDRRKRERYQRQFNPGRRRWRPGGNRARRLKYADRIQHDEFDASDPDNEAI